MKYAEFHRFIRKNEWKFSHAEGSHYFYIKNEVLSPPVPYHGAKEIGEGLRKKLIKEMGLE
ncbi:MAG: type II toxin-antitoxin system HicA family toxin [Bacteroidales bacterium]|nr:type II toxin-antitoxin system HicA family toxin [Bacteroidales bacterium]